MTEILAPCGDFEALRGAVNGRANAVYLGLKQFSARASAGNFDAEELKAGTELCHAFGMKVYVTLNTLLSDRELKQTKESIRACAEAAVDGIIVQDLGLFHVLKQTTDFPLHFSTQGGVFHAEGAAVVKELGFSRVVLARETERGEVERIGALGLETEVFVHGALCTAFSGNCYLSSFLSSTSGNRGRCLQPCRLKYACLPSDSEKILGEGYLLSSRDECMLGNLEKLISERPDSLKIEGRLKRPEYACETSRAYAAELSRLDDNSLDEVSSAADRDSLARLFNRGGFCKGLAGGRDGVIFRSVQGHFGVPVGKITRVSGGRAFANCEVRAGDGFKVFRKNSEVGSASVNESGVLSVRGDVRPGDSLHITTDAAQLERIRAVRRKLAVRVELTARCGEPLRAVLTCPERGAQITFSAGVVAEAKSCPADENSLRTCFERTGEYPFELESFCCETESAFLPKSVLNEFRRNCFAELFEKLAQAPKRNFDGDKFDALFLNADSVPAERSGRNEDRRQIAVFSRFDEPEALSAPLFDELVYAPAEYFDETFFETWDRMKRTGKPCLLDLPLFLYRSDFELFENYADRFDGLYVHNIAGVGLCKRLNKRLVLSPDLNVFNSPAVRVYRDYYPCEIVLSEELHAAQAEEIERRCPGVLVTGAGRQVLMRLNHCARKETLGETCSACPHGRRGKKPDGGGRSSGTGERFEFCYRNEYGQTFPVARTKVGQNCYFCLLNGSLTYKCSESFRGRNGLWDFSHADEGLLGDVSAFLRGESAPVRENFTLGHWKRKVL